MTSNTSFVIDSQPQPTPWNLATISGEVQSHQQLEFLKTVNYIKTRYEYEGFCCGKNSLTYTFFDEKKQAIFQAHQENSANGGCGPMNPLVITDAFAKPIGIFEFNASATTCFSPPSYHEISISSPPGNPIGSIVMNTPGSSKTNFEVRNSRSQVIVMVNPKTRLLQKTQYPIVMPSGNVVADISYKPGTTVLTMSTDFIPPVKLLLSILALWINMLEEEKSTSGSSAYAS